MCSQPDAAPPRVREEVIADGVAALYARDTGAGLPIIVLHGGPDFDHGYLLPELDRLAAHHRVVTYDQRGRGRSAANVRAGDVSMATEIADLDRIRAHLGVDTMAVLGHSWGGVLALAYALAHPHRVSHLILLGSAPVTSADWWAFREHRARMAAGELAAMREIAATEAFAEGDPDAVAAYYRLHFRSAVARPEQVDTLVARLRQGFTREGILLARAIEDRLMAETARSPGFDLIPALRGLDVPALVLHGERDFIPVPLAARIAGALPQGRLVVLPGCGHVLLLECPEATIAAIAGFLQGSGARA